MKKILDDPAFFVVSLEKGEKSGPSVYTKCESKVSVGDLKQGINPEQRWQK